MYRPPGAPQPPGQAAWQHAPVQPGRYQQQQGPGQPPNGGYSYPALGPSAAAYPPPPAAADMPATAVNSGRLRSVDELPGVFPGVFPGFRFFNAIQNESWGAIWEGNSNVVISAPTGGGACAAAVGRWVLSALLGPPAACHQPSWPAQLRPHQLLNPQPPGKTVLLELAILRLLSAHLTPAGQFQHRPGHLKAVYLAPSRALVQVGGRGA